MTAANFNNAKDFDAATSVSNSTPSESSAPAPQDRSDLDPLMSFVDMIFGGKLTSILVCQKCKHVSQSYEDFNDISLSIKPEDYFFGRGSNVHGRRRDRLKKLAKKLTTFSGSGGGGSHATQSSNLDIKSTTELSHPVAVSSLEVQRSSSLPPSPSRLRPRDGNAHMDSEDDGHSGLVPRRKSLDLAETGVVGGMSKVDLDVGTSPSSLEAESDIEGVGRAELEVPPSEVLSGLESLAQGALENSGKDGNIMESDNLHVHFVSPEESYMEPTEKAKVKNNSKKEDVGWVKLGRRLSTMTAGLGRSKDKERDRKRWSMNRNGLADGSMEKSISDSVVNEETAGLDTQIENSLTSSEGEGMIRHSRTMSVAAVDSKEATPSNLASDHATYPRPIAARASSSPSAPASTTVHNIFRPLPRGFSSLATPTLNTPTMASTSQLQNPHLVASSDALHLPNTSSSPFPNVQRSRSPRPPKPTTAESQYLRKILADVSSSPSGLNSPFSFFKPPTLKIGAQPFSASASSLTSSSGHGGGTGMWLGLNHFSGIEECLRLFTAVEVLDGENMVGCRRCWKIANGVLDTKNSTRQEDEDSDQEQEQEEEEGDSRRHETQTGQNGLINQDQVVLANEGGLKKSPPVLEALSIANINTSIHIPTSMSTPTVSFYTLPNSSDSGSILSLPTQGTSVLNGNEDSSLVGFSPKESGEDNDNTNPGPGGMLIPIISTTSPVDTPVDPLTSFARAQRLAVSAKESVVESSVMDGAEDNGQGRSNNALSISALLSTHVTPLSSVPSPLSQVLFGYNASGSKDSLLIPKMPRHQRRRTYNSSPSPSASTTDNESSDDDESDTSVGTSVSGESHTSTSVTNHIPSNSSIPQSNSQVQQQVAAQQPSSSTSTQPIKPREKKPKPVIMRPAYKRYLISLPPPVLVIHLKRFQQTSKIPLISFSHGLKKLDDYVSFPEYFDLMPFLAPKKEDYGLGKKKKKGVVKTKEERCMYRLYAVVVHIGNMVSSSFSPT